MKHVKLFEQFINEKKGKSDYEDIIDKYESKIWELDNANASWIPDNPTKKAKMRETFQKKIDAAQKALDKLDESTINEARAPKTREELIAALDDAYEKMEKYNQKYYSLSRAPGGGSWSSNSKEGKAAAKYKKMANNQQANIWKWTDKLRKLGFEYNVSESYKSLNEGITQETDKVASEFKKELTDMKSHFGSRLKSDTIWWDGVKKVMRATEGSEGLEPSKEGIIPMYLYWMSKYRTDKGGKYTKLAKEIEKQGIKLEPQTSEKNGSDSWKITIN